MYNIEDPEKFLQVIISHYRLDCNLDEIIAQLSPELGNKLKGLLSTISEDYTLELHEMDRFYKSILDINGICYEK